MNGRRDSGVRTEDGVGQFEEGVAPKVEAFVERAAETVESIGTFHDAPIIMHSPTTLRIPYLPVELKRKLRLYPKTAKLSNTWAQANWINANQFSAFLDHLVRRLRRRLVSQEIVRSTTHLLAG